MIQVSSAKTRKEPNTFCHSREGGNLGPRAKPEDDIGGEFEKNVDN